MKTNNKSTEVIKSINTALPKSFPDVKTADTATPIAFFNEHSGKVTPITKFRDRATAEAKVKELIVAMKEMAGRASGVVTKADCVEGKAEKKLEKKTEGETKSKTEGTTKSGAGRKSDWAGGKITKVSVTNPRKEGTWGWKSFELIKNGMTYEEYIAAGGRNNDLRWDVDHNFVTVTRA